jgi:flap endonuclease-1
MIEEAKKLIRAMGLPVVEAPSEGEAQAAYMVKQDHAYAAASQDADSLMFGSPRLLRNLSLAGKRKKTNKLAFEEIKPELVVLQDTLSALGISHDQLIALGMLVGTDFNIGGIKGIGPKNAVKLVKKYDTNLDGLFKEAKWNESFEYPWEEVYSLFKKMPITDDYFIEWRVPDRKKTYELLVEEHEFSEERVNSTLDRLEEEKKKYAQKGLGEFFR